jgi:hypothetical protein
LKDLFTGIYTKFSTTPASSFYNAVSGRMYLEEAPQNTAYPYAVYSLVNNSPDLYWNSRLEEGTIDFNLYSDSTAGATEITQLYEKLKEQFDDASLTVSGYSHLRFRRENAWLNKMPSEIPNKSIWAYTVQYNVLLHTT